MERPVFQPVGTAVEDLDTPALVVDLDLMEGNIEVLHSYFRQSDTKVRPNLAAHQCPQIGHRQLEAGGTVGGIVVTTLGEAEVFINAGFNNVLVTNQIVTRPKIIRVCALSKSSSLSVAVDNRNNVDDLSEAAAASGVTLQVLVEVDAGLGRCGVQPGQPALDLAKHVARAPGLSFGGLMTVLPTPTLRNGDSADCSSQAGADDTLSPSDREAMESKTRHHLQSLVNTRELIENDGLAVTVVGVAGTHSYHIAAQVTGVTEVQAGSYPLMDYSYRRIRPEFKQAVKILAQVISHPVGPRAVLDAGHQATGPDSGLPILEGFPGATATRFSAEHCVLEFEGVAQTRLMPGEKVWLIPRDLRLCLNQYDYIRAVRGGKLEGFWPMGSRGRFG